MLVPPQVHSCLSVEETVECLSSPADRVGIHPLVHLGHRVEQAPGCSGLELTVTGFTPLMQHLGNLSRGDSPRIQCSYHDVVCPLVAEPRLAIAQASSCAIFAASFRWG